MNLFRDLRDGLVVFDGQGRVLGLNRAAEKIFATTCEAATEGYLSSLFAGASLPKPSLPLQAVEQIESESGVTYEMQISAHIEGDSSIYACLIRDMTRELQAADLEAKETELRGRLFQANAQKMESLSIMAGGIAHDLNNMLAPIMGIPQLLRMDLPPDSPMLKDIAVIEKAAKDAHSLIQDMATISSQGEYELTPIQLDQMLEEFISGGAFKALYNSFPGVKLRQAFNSRPVRVEGSIRHLQRVVLNLVHNAFEASDEEGEIVIGTAIERTDNPVPRHDSIVTGEYVVLSIRDQGIGIKPEHLEKIWDPFYTKRRRGTGTGLGLAIVYGIVKDMNGFIEVDSECNKGTTFRLYFPVLQKVEDTPATETIFGQETVLVVDDVLQQRKLSQRVLSRLGYNVVCVSSGEEALDALGKNPIHAMQLDMNLDADYDGLDLFEIIHGRYPELPVLIVSGVNDSERIEQAIDLGAAGHVSKPYTRDQIGRSLRQALNGRFNRSLEPQSGPT